MRCELAATQEELRQARLAIQERDHAIATHQRCEAALAGHAGTLNEALADAVADVALLFQRWDEKNALEDANAALVQVGRLERASQAGRSRSAACGAQWAVHGTPVVQLRPSSRRAVSRLDAPAPSLPCRSCVTQRCSDWAPSRQR